MGERVSAPDLDVGTPPNPKRGGKIRRDVEIPHRGGLILKNPLRKGKYIQYGCYLCPNRV